MEIFNEVFSEVFTVSKFMKIASLSLCSQPADLAIKSPSVDT